MRVDHEQRARQSPHATDAAQGVVRLFDLFAELAGLFLGQPLELTRLAACLERLQALDPPLDGGEVGEHAAQPAVVDVVLAAALGLGRNRLLRLLLGADEEDAVATANCVADELEGILQPRHGLGQVDDVDPVALGEDVGAHLGFQRRV